MFCPQCGCEQGAAGHFCRQCGIKFAEPAVPSYAGYGVTRPYARVTENLQALAILWYVFGAMRIMTGLAAMLALHTMTRVGWFLSAETPSFLPHLFSVLAPVVMVTAATTGLLALFVGHSLQTRQPWGRTLAIVAGILALIKIPIGTALGIYTLWVLGPSISGEEWRTQRIAA